eukprot:416650-Pyramimonas_sp.AAC.1
MGRTRALFLPRCRTCKIEGVLRRHVRPQTSSVVRLSAHITFFLPDRALASIRVLLASMTFVFCNSADCSHLAAVKARRVPGAGPHGCFIEQRDNDWGATPLPSFEARSARCMTPAHLNTSKLKELAAPP